MEENKFEEKKVDKTKKIISNILSSLLIFVLLLFLGIKINFSQVVVRGQSMFPTLIGDSSRGYEYGYTDRFIFKITGLDRYDIVVIKTKNDDLWIKRLIGMPNETIQIIDGSVYINDKLLETDPCSDIYITNPGIAQNKIYLFDDEYFVLGDNRNNSSDSRSNELGVINYKQIYGHGFISRGYYETTECDEIISKHDYEVKGW